MSAVWVLVMVLRLVVVQSHLLHLGREKNTSFTIFSSTQRDKSLPISQILYAVTQKVEMTLSELEQTCIGHQLTTKRKTYKNVGVKWKICLTKKIKPLTSFTVQLRPVVRELLSFSPLSDKNIHVEVAVWSNFCCLFGTCLQH